MSKLVGCYRKRPSKHTGCGSLASLIPKFPVSSTIYWVVKIIIPNICILFWTKLSYFQSTGLLCSYRNNKISNATYTYSAFTVEWRKPNVAWCHGNINIQIGVHTGKHNNNVEIMRLTDNKLLNCLCGTVDRIHIFVMFLSYLPFEANIFYFFIFFLLLQAFNYGHSVEGICQRYNLCLAGLGTTAYTTPGYCLKGTYQPAE